MKLQIFGAFTAYNTTIRSFIRYVTIHISFIHFEASKRRQDSKYQIQLHTILSKRTKFLKTLRQLFIIIKYKSIFIVYAVNIVFIVTTSKIDALLVVENYCGTLVGFL